VACAFTALGRASANAKCELRGAPRIYLASPGRTLDRRHLFQRHYPVDDVRPQRPPDDRRGRPGQDALCVRRWARPSPQPGLRYSSRLTREWSFPPTRSLRAAPLAWQCTHIGCLFRALGWKPLVVLAWAVGLPSGVLLDQVDEVRCCWT